MEFTGKNKKAFAKYLRKQRFGILFDPEKSNNPYVVNLAEMFEKLPLSMQFGVVQDYADSIGIFITIIPSELIYNRYAVKYSCFERMVLPADMDNFKTRNEARLAAIKVFDEIVSG